MDVRLGADRLHLSDDCSPDITHVFSGAKLIVGESSGSGQPVAIHLPKSWSIG